MIRTFHLRRDVDHTGVTGTGIVAAGIVFDDGTTVVRWEGEHRSTVIWPSLEDALAIHGHDGTTQAIFHDSSEAQEAAAEIMTQEWRSYAAAGARATPEEFCADFARRLAEEGLLR